MYESRLYCLSHFTPQTHRNPCYFALFACSRENRQAAQTCMHGYMSTFLCDLCAGAHAIHLLFITKSIHPIPSHPIRSNRDFDGFGATWCDYCKNCIELYCCKHMSRSSLMIKSVFRAFRWFLLVLSQKILTLARSRSLYGACFGH